MESSIFTKIINREIPAEIIFENEQVISILDINPNNVGHALVIPKKHSQNILDTNPEILCEMMRIVKHITPAILKYVNSNDFNLHVNNGEYSGQVIYHLHFHIIPRFENDGLQNWHNVINQKNEERSKLAKSIREHLFQEDFR